MQLPLNLSPLISPSLVTTEASKTLGLVTTSPWHLSFWQLRFTEEIDRSHSLFCFEIVSSRFLKMAGLLLINLFPTLYPWQLHEAVFFPQNLFFHANCLPQLEKCSAKHSRRSCQERTGLLLPSQLPPATLKFWFPQQMGNRSILWKCPGTPAACEQPCPENVQYIVYVTCALGMKSKTKCPLKLVPITAHLLVSDKDWNRGLDSFVFFRSVTPRSLQQLSCSGNSTLWHSYFPFDLQKH